LQHPTQDVRRSDGDRRHRHVDVSAQQSGALALSVVDPVDAKEHGGAAGALAAQQIDDGPVGGRPRAALAAAAVDGQPAGGPRPVGELRGADVLADGK
jgi:hypothetical protein